MVASLLNPDNPFVGRGWAFPLEIDSNGDFATVAGVEEIEQSIFLILATTPGERPMRPDFGCGLIDLVFEPLDVVTANAISDMVRASLERWEPRVDVVQVDVHLDVGGGRALIDIHYRIKNTYDKRSLVFPFYVIPEHEEN